MSEEKEGTEALFTETAMPDRDWWQVLWPDPASVLTQIGVRKGMHVVDLCCGDGYFTAPLSLLIADGQVFAVDLLEEMLDRARAEVERAGITNVVFIRGNARDVSVLVPHSLDVAIIANTFHGVDDQTGLAVAVREVLKPGGWFVVINWYPAEQEETSVLGKPRGPRPELRMAPEAVKAAVEPAGLVEVEVTRVGPYHYASIFEHPAEGRKSHLPATPRFLHDQRARR